MIASDLLLRKATAHDPANGQFTSGSGKGYSVTSVAGGRHEVHSDADGKIGNLHELMHDSGKVEHRGVYTAGPRYAVSGPNSTLQPASRDASRMATAVRLAAHHEGGLRKTVGDFVSQPSAEAAEIELLTLLDQADQAYQVAFEKLANVKSKLVAGLSPQARASLEIMGRDAGSDVSRLDDVRFEVQKRLASVRRATGAATLSKSLGEAQRDLEILKKHSEAIIAGQVRVTPEIRRRLSLAITTAELEVQAASQ